MKIGIVSDLHLGYERFREDAYNQAKRAIELAASTCDAILIPGDVFDGRSPPPDVIAEGINLFRDASKMEWKACISQYNAERETHTSIPVIAISGTHERTAIGRANALRLLDLAGLLVDASEATVVISKGTEKVAVYGIGGISEESFKSKMEEMKIKPFPGAFNIFMFHQSVYELLPFSEQFVHFGDLPEGFDLYIDGHLHSQFETKVHGKKFLIPGSTVITQLKDGEQTSKGFIIFDTESYKHEFIEIGSRRFVSHAVEVSGKSGEEIKAECSEIIDRIIKESKEKPIIRIKLQGEIRHGISNSDINVKSTIAKYSQFAFVEIDSSKMTSKSIEEGIKSVRSSEIQGESVKERGIGVLYRILESSGFSLEIKPGELIEILVNGNQRKEKLTEEILAILDSSP